MKHMVYLLMVFLVTSTVFASAQQTPGAETNPYLQGAFSRGADAGAERPGAVEQHEYQNPIFRGKLDDDQRLEKMSYEVFPRAGFDPVENAKRVQWMVDQKQRAIANEINRTKPLQYPVSGR